VLVLVLDLAPTAVLTARLATMAAAVQAPPLEPHAHSHGNQGPQDLLTRVQQATHRLAEVQQVHHAVLVAARQAGASWRQLAAAARLSPSRIRQLLARPPGTGESTSPVVRSS